MIVSFVFYYLLQLPLRCAEGYASCLLAITQGEPPLSAVSFYMRLYLYRSIELYIGLYMPPDAVVAAAAAAAVCCRARELPHAAFGLRGGLCSHTGDDPQTIVS